MEIDHWPDHEEVLERFRGWLEEARAEAASLEEFADDDGLDEPLGIYQLVEQLTALRHDVKLLTKASRGTEERTDERTEETLLALHAAIEQFRAAETNEDDAADRATRPFVEAVIDFDEALSRCRHAIERARQRTLESLHAELRQVAERLDDLYRTQPWWRRILCRPWHEAAKGLYTERSLDTYRGLFDSLLEGYGLIENRLRRTMKERSIVRIQCLGEPADPNRMTVLEVVVDPSRRPGTVIDEVRPGYCFRGRVFRFAEVKAVADQ